MSLILAKERRRHQVYKAVLAKISKAQAVLRGNYVYVYYDTEADGPLYIGRGKRERVPSPARFSHNGLVRDRI